MSCGYYFSLLDEKEQQLYAYIREKLLIFSQYIDVFATVPTVQKVLKAILLDTPMLFWFQGKWRGQSLENNCLRIFPHYSVTAFERGIVGKKIDKIVSRIVSKKYDSKIACVRGIYDWFLDHVQYGQSRNDQTVQGAFIDRLAVCKGIAKAFQMCMDAIDIPCVLVEGTIDQKMSHAWNIISLEGTAYHIDITMGYACFFKCFDSVRRIPRYSCFMLSDRMIQKTHRTYCNNMPQCQVDFDMEKLLIQEAVIPPEMSQHGHIRYLDRGGTCEVFLLEKDGKQFALKVLRADKHGNTHEKAKGELSLMHHLRGCDHVVPLVDSAVNESEKSVYLLFPFLTLLSKRRKEKDFDVYDDTKKLGMDILLAMIECKAKGVYHLDIQPKNIYFDSTGKAMLGDFGNSVFETELSSLKRCIGTIAFMAPEVFLQGKYSEASEIYSLGIVMYSLLNHARLPFEGKESSKNALKRRLDGNELPVPCLGESPLWNCIQKMTEYDVDKRFHSYAEVLNILGNI